MNKKKPYLLGTPNTRSIQCFSKMLFRYVQPYFKETKSESVTHLISTIQYYSIILEWLIAGFEIIPPQFAEHILPMVIAALDITNRAE